MRTLAAAGIVMVLACMSGCSRMQTLPASQTVLPTTGFQPTVSRTIKMKGIASWYGPKWHGKQTASGEIFDQHKFTAAHRTLPFGTKVRVRNLENGKEVVVEITDRGPNKKRRLIDLSHAAAEEIGLKEDGTGPVEIEVLEKPAKEK